MCEFKARVDAGPVRVAAVVVEPPPANAFIVTVQADRWGEDCIGKGSRGEACVGKGGWGDGGDVVENLVFMDGSDRPR